MQVERWVNGNSSFQMQNMCNIVKFTTLWILDQHIKSMHVLNFDYAYCRWSKARKLLASKKQMRNSVCSFGDGVGSANNILLRRVVVDSVKCQDLSKKKINKQKNDIQKCVIFPMIPLFFPLRNKLMQNVFPRLGTTPSVFLLANGDQIIYVATSNFVRNSLRSSFFSGSLPTARTLFSFWSNLQPAATSRVPDLPTCQAEAKVQEQDRQREIVARKVPDDRGYGQQETKKTPEMTQVELRVASLLGPKIRKCSPFQSPLLTAEVVLETWSWIDQRKSFPSLFC